MVRHRPFDPPDRIDGCNGGIPRKRISAAGVGDPRESIGARYRRIGATPPVTRPPNVGAETERLEELVAPTRRHEASACARSLLDICNVESLNRQKRVSVCSDGCEEPERHCVVTADDDPYRTDRVTVLCRSRPPWHGRMIAQASLGCSIVERPHGCDAAPERGSAVTPLVGPRLGDVTAVPIASPPSFPSCAIVQYLRSLDRDQSRSNKDDQRT